MTDNHDNFYQTGSTTPPKGSSGLLAILLVLVIILAGLVSILSLMNIRMFSAFYQAQKQEAAVSLELSPLPSEGDSLNPEEEAAFSEKKSIGITGEAITPVYQQHFDLPEGLFITYVEDGSVAQKQNIQEGDVLLALDDLPITDEQSLKSFLAQKNPGDPCTARIYRLEDQQQLSVQLTIEEID